MGAWWKDLLVAVLPWLIVVIDTSKFGCFQYAENPAGVIGKGPEGDSWWYSGREEVRMFGPRRKTLLVYHRILTDDTISLKFEQPPLIFSALKDKGK